MSSRSVRPSTDRLCASIGYVVNMGWLTVAMTGIERKPINGLRTNNSGIGIHFNIRNAVQKVGELIPSKVHVTMAGRSQTSGSAGQTQRGRLVMTMRKSRL